MLKYSMPKSVSLSQIETRVADIFYMAKTCNLTSSELASRLIDRVVDPINEKYSSGRRKHSVWLAGYVGGLISAGRNNIWRNDVEFCYLVEGILYSTHKNSTKLKTEEFYERGEGNKLANSEGRHYWIGTDKIYS